MAKQIRIKTGSVTALAELNDTNTAEAIWQALPLNSDVKTWGDEIYFSIPVKVELEDGQELVNTGDLGYWPTGSAFCVFFGPTPVSGEGEIRPASAVNVFGKLLDEPTLFKDVKGGERITVEKA